MKLPHLPPISKSIWYCILGCLAVATVWAVVIIPEVTRLQTNVQALLDAQMARASSTEAAANLISVVQRKTELTTQVERLQSMFVPRSNPVVFVSRLEELAADAQVTLDINLQNPSANVATLPIAPATTGMQVDGDYLDVLAFLNAVLADPVIIQIQQLDIATPSDKAGVVSVDITATTYWR